MQKYVDKVAADMRDAQRLAGALGARFDREVDSIYLGGGTPTTLSPEQLEELFQGVRDQFTVSSEAEITIECAPGTLSDALLATFTRCGVNRVSLGVQSFVDKESHAVGRTHTRESVLKDIARLRKAGIHNISIDLIAGLPHQSRESWHESLTQAIDTDVPHMSVYILEVDEDSRLGKELVAGGARYHARHVPNEDLCAELYSLACERLDPAGVAQYEISNFARSGFESKHNLKYWIRQPYLGFGLDAHSMLFAGPDTSENPDSVAAVRFSTRDDLEAYLNGSGAYESQCVTRSEAVEEELFLGLRLNRGVDVGGVRLSDEQAHAIDELAESGLLLREDTRIRLTDRGRPLSNEVFARLIADKTATVA